MNEYQLFAFLQGYSFELLALAVLVYITNSLIEYFIKNIPYKILSIMPFVLSAVFYLGYAIIFDTTLSSQLIINCSISVGGLATLFSSLFSKISKNIASNIAQTDCLEVITNAYLSLDKLKEIYEYTQNGDIDKEQLKDIIVTQLKLSQIGQFEDVILNSVADKIIDNAKHNI